ncbi:MAG: hypothetical protein E7612_02860 [Ruminococcaceae bacterium]|nr:hypothetical protein [Oscillospiraceae bacterium]
MARRSYRAVVRKQNLEKNLLKKDVVKIANSSEKRVGNVYRGRTKYIDSENKLERNYVVLKDSSKGIAVAKLKSIKKFDSNGKNADKALQEINHSRYGLPKRTGVDFQKFSKNRMTKKPLKLEDKKVFPEKSARFKLSSHDLSRVLRHTKIKK